MLFSVTKGVKHNCGFLLKNACFAGLNQRFTRYEIPILLAGIAGFGYCMSELLKAV